MQTSRTGRFRRGFGGVLFYCLPSIASWFWGPLGGPWVQEVLKQDANPSQSEQGHWPSLPHIWWQVLSARQMSKIRFPKHNHFWQRHQLLVCHLPPLRDGKVDFIRHSPAISQTEVEERASSSPNSSGVKMKRKKCYRNAIWIPLTWKGFNFSTVY